MKSFLTHRSFVNSITGMMLAAGGLIIAHRNTRLWLSTSVRHDPNGQILMTKANLEGERQVLQKLATELGRMMRAGYGPEHVAENGN